MTEPLSHLLGVAICVGCVGLGLLWKRLPAWLLLPILVIKLSIPVTYFAFYYDGTWNFLDDFTYYDESANLVALGYTPYELLTTDEGQKVVTSVSGSRHTFYYVVNTLAIQLFGDFYSSGVFFNIAISIASACLFAKSMERLGFEPTYCRWLLAFQLLHWEYLSWTSLINAKDTVVELLIVTTLYHVIRWQQQHSLLSAIMMIISIYLLTTVRLYVPPVMFAGITLATVISSKDIRAYVILLAGSAASLYYLRNYSQHLNSLRFDDVIYGSIRFVLTPRPWDISVEKSFLFWPSIFQWSTMPLALFGAIHVWRSRPAVRIFLCVLLAFVLFYGVFIYDPSPRLRLQIAGLFALTQFHCIWTVFHWLFQRNESWNLDLAVNHLERA
ncbi:MAG: hypothetical protein R3C28_24355 [Pirellulaceae bacterium]